MTEEYKDILNKREKEYKQLKEHYSDIIHTLKPKSEIDLNTYLLRRKEIEDKYNETHCWDEVITTVVYWDDSQSNEAFIDIVEHIYKTKIENVKHLKKLTGIKQETLKGLQETIHSAREMKYYDVIKNALEKGAKYKDLIKLKPENYELPKSWERGKEPEKEIMNSETLIKRAIFFTFSFGESHFISPDLRRVAELLEAPYSFILEAKNYYKIDKE
ncbi:MAG: hypothetical protein WAT71_18005 [Ignavibacteria bacterium]